MSSDEDARLDGRIYSPEMKADIEGERPTELRTNLTPDELPDDLLADLTTQLVVEATCPDCGHTDYYVNVHDEPPFCRGDCTTRLLTAFA